MTDQEYAVFCRPFDRALQKLLLDFKFFQEDMVGLNVQTVSSRLKTFVSASRKQAELNLAIEDMQDIAGMRIVVSTEPEVEVVRSYFSTQEGFNAFNVIKDQAISRDNGYRARHLVLEFDWTVNMPKKASVEVQLATALQHAFNSVSRAWIYKSSVEPSTSWERDFREVSRALLEVEGHISRLQSELVAAAASPVAREPMTAFSFQSIVREVFGETASINESVDAVRLLTHLGLATNNDLRRYFDDQGIQNILEGWNELAKLGDGMAQVFTGMLKHEFFVRWGTRGDQTLGLLNLASRRSGVEKVPGDSS